MAWSKRSTTSPACGTSGHPTLLVSSGAVAAGIPALGLTGRPRDVPGLQAAAAVGQGLLMERYAAMFKSRGKIVGQVLLTKDVLANRSQYLNARNTLERMLSLGVVPIINENDTVVVDEFRLGGNDELAAIVSHLVSAGMLVILTDIGGIYSGDPRTMDDVELLSAVHSGDTALDHIAGGAPGPFGSGGPATKVMAARMAAWSGIPTVIADARETGVVARAASGEAVGTWVTPHESRLPARKLWIAFGLPVDGTAGGGPRRGAGPARRGTVAPRRRDHGGRRRLRGRGRCRGERRGWLGDRQRLGRDDGRRGPRVDRPP